MSFIDPDIDFEVLHEANRRHDAAPHEVTMWQRARYRGKFGYPPDPKPKRKRLIRFMDAQGQIHSELR